MQLVGNHVNSTVNNPNEAVAQWRGGKLRPLCVFDGKPLPYKEKIVADMSWGDIPTCKSQGLDIEYLMLRGIFMTPGATKDQVDYYVELFKKVRETPEWKKLMKDGAFNQTFMTGADYTKWVAGEEKRHRELMKEAGFLAQVMLIADHAPPAERLRRRRSRSPRRVIECPTNRTWPSPGHRTAPSKSAVALSPGVFGTHHHCRQLAGRHRLGRRRSEAGFLSVLCLALSSSSRASSTWCRPRPGGIKRRACSRAGGSCGR